MASPPTPRSVSLPPSPSPVQVVSARPMPARLATALQRAHAAELLAIGDQRRAAFRLTRALLGGARRAGYSTVLLAECIGVSLSSVRARGGSDGWITAEVMADLSDLAPGTVERWQVEGLLPTSTVDGLGERWYAASELIQALTRPIPSAERSSPGA